MKHQGLDHLAIVVKDTEKALALWNAQLQFPVIHSEVVNEGTVRLTHLDLGNTHLQLVQPLTPDHPLQAWLEKNGSGLHHFCLKVDDVSESIQQSTLPITATPHQGIQGKRAVFLDADHTNGTLVELTGK